MAGEWRTLTVDQIKASDDRAIAIGPFGSRMKADAYVETGVPVIRGNNISDTRSFAGDFVFVSDETADQLRSSNVFAGDLVFPHRGAIGQVGIISNGDIRRYMLSTSLMKLTCNRELVDPLFIFYFFRSPLGRHALLEHASTVGTPGIGQPLTSLRSIQVPVPPLAEQRAVAHILGTLDDKIELNRRMNETLEAMTRALFRSWFVDFDPVRAKAEGRDADLPPHLAALFPDSFEDSELGEIPAGWRVAPIGNHITADRGLSYNGAGLRDDGTGLPMHNLNSIYEGGGYKHEGLKFYDGEYREKHLVHPGDLIITNTEQGFDHLLIGHAAIVPDRYGPHGLFSHHIFHISVKAGSPFTPHYLFQVFNDPRWHEVISGFSNGTTINMLPRDALVLPLVIVPSAELVAEFSILAATVHSRVEASGKESLTLAALRDALLPKLISGEIRVSRAVHAA